MAILLCNKCGHLREARSEYAGKSVICPKCKKAEPSLAFRFSCIDANV